MGCLVLLQHYSHQREDFVYVIIDIFYVLTQRLIRCSA